MTSANVEYGGAQSDRAETIQLLCCRDFGGTGLLRLPSEQRSDALLLVCIARHVGVLAEGDHDPWLAVDPVDRVTLLLVAGAS